MLVAGGKNVLQTETETDIATCDRDSRALAELGKATQALEAAGVDKQLITNLIGAVVTHTVSDLLVEMYHDGDEPSLTAVARWIERWDLHSHINQQTPGAPAQQH